MSFPSLIAKGNRLPNLDFQLPNRKHCGVGTGGESIAVVCVGA
jgi:hypothetical protein